MSRVSSSCDPCLQLLITKINLADNVLDRIMDSSSTPSLSPMSSLGSVIPKIMIHTNGFLGLLAWIAYVPAGSLGIKLNPLKWVPEGDNRHSQSVIDLFDFIRSSAQVILHELPLSEYKRAIYLIDFSKVLYSRLWN